MTIHIVTLIVILSVFLIIGFITGWKFAGFRFQNGSKKNSKNH